MTDFLFRTGKNVNHPQFFVEEYKYSAEGKKMVEYNTDDVEISSDDSHRKDSDEEISNDKNSDEENSDEENFNEEN